MLYNLYNYIVNLSNPSIFTNLYNLFTWNKTVKDQNDSSSDCLSEPEEIFIKHTLFGSLSLSNSTLDIINTSDTVVDTVDTVDIKQSYPDKYYYLSLVSDIDLSNKYSIHGFWPQFNDGKYPTYCKKVTFDINKLESIMKDLQKYWKSQKPVDLLAVSPKKRGNNDNIDTDMDTDNDNMDDKLTINIESSDEEFWSHEWKKHGSCMFTDMDELQYFQKTLELYFHVIINGICIKKYKEKNSENYILPFDTDFNFIG